MYLAKQYWWSSNQLSFIYTNKYIYIMCSYIHWHTYVYLTNCVVKYVSDHIVILKMLAETYAWQNLESDWSVNFWMSPTNIICIGLGLVDSSRHN